ncbi:MAG: hypothetical protein JZU70_07995 [Chlorobium sp.]|nr:hypothetical protein [Chlorobium sp.]
MNICIDCIMLMDFDLSMTFVYHHGIEIAIKEIADELCFEIIIKKVDLFGSTQENKLNDIKDLIENSDLVIADLTNNKPSVLWELGYASHCKKQILSIIQDNQDIQKLPYNIKGLDPIKYELSVSGLDAFRKKFKEQNKDLFKKVYNKKIQYSSHPMILDMINTMREGFDKIKNNSLLEALATNELSRLYDRINKLLLGTFELRNQKPNDEIIKYYCDYIGQLDNENCEFKTITMYNFWKEITKEGTDDKYFGANIRVARKQAKIKRLFIVDSLIINNEKDLSLFKKILSNALESKLINNKVLRRF